MKTILIVKTSMDKLNAVREELRKKYGSKGKMSQSEYVVDDVRYLFVFLSVHVQWDRLHGFRVDDVDMDDVMDRLRELELYATKISLDLMRK